MRNLRATASAITMTVSLFGCSTAPPVNSFDAYGGGILSASVGPGLYWISVRAVGGTANDYALPKQRWAAQARTVCSSGSWKVIAPQQYDVPSNLKGDRMFLPGAGSLSLADPMLGVYDAHALCSDSPLSLAEAEKRVAKN